MTEQIVISCSPIECSVEVAHMSVPVSRSFWLPPAYIVPAISAKESLDILNRGYRI